jgi:flagellin-like protein
MINKNKKGLSDVVTTVLIILFAVVAVAVIGAIVLNQVKGAGGKIDSATMCAEFEVTPVKCSNTSATNSYLTVQRGAGGKDFTVKSMSAVFEKADGTTDTATIASIPAAFTSAQGTKAGVSFTSYKKAGVAVVLTDSNGKDVSCDYYKTTMVDCA